MELFQFANVEPLNPELQPADVPTRVTVAEGKHQRVNFGVGYGTEEKARVDAEYHHVNFLGGARSAGAHARWSSLDRGVRARLQPAVLLRAAFLARRRRAAVVHVHARLPLDVTGGKMTLTHRHERAHVVGGVDDQRARQQPMIADEALNDPTLRNDLIALGLDPTTRRAERHAERARLRLPALDRRQPAERAPRLSARVSCRRGRTPACPARSTTTRSSADGRHYLPLGDRARASPAALQIGNIRPVGDDRSQRAVLEEVFPRRRDEHPRLGTLRGQPAQRIGAADRRQQHARVQRGAARRRCAAISAASCSSTAATSGPSRWAFKLDDLRYAVGPGLRYQTPIGPIRFDFGYQLNPIPGLLVNGSRSCARGACTSASARRSDDASNGRQSAVSGLNRTAGWSRSCAIVRRLVHVLIIVLTLVVGAAAAAIIVSQTAWFKNWLRGYIVRAGATVPERHAVDRAARRQPVLRRRDGEHRRLDGRQPGRGGQGSRPRLQRLPAAHAEGCRSTTSASTSRSIYLRREGDTWSLSRLVKKQEQRSRSRGPDEPDRHRRHRHQRRIGRRRPAGRHVAASTCRSDSITSTRSCRSSTSRSATRSRSRTCRSAARSRRWRSTRCRAASSVKDDTLFVDKLALRTAEIVAVGRRRGAALSDQAAVQPADQLGQAVAAGNRAARAGARRRPAAAVVRTQARRAAGSARRRDERPVVGGAGRAASWSPTSWRPASRSPATLGAPSRSRAAAERPAAEERHHGGRARRPPWRGAVEHQCAARHVAARCAAARRRRLRRGACAREGADRRTPGQPSTAARRHMARRRPSRET